jgi:hypothetical protein
MLTRGDFVFGLLHQMPQSWVTSAENDMMPVAGLMG